MPPRTRPRSHLRLRSSWILLTGLVQIASHLLAFMLLARMTLRLTANLRFLQSARRLASLPAARLPRVSVLIPARDEVDAITACVTSLLAQQYPNLEILVLDDGSTDGTGQLLDTLADQRQRPYHPQPSLTVIHSPGDPPPGWNGKSYACHRLAQRATGEWLLFTDADTLHSPTSVVRGVTQALALHTDLLSAFPYQGVETWSERLLVSFILDFLPLTSVNLAAMWRHHSGRPLANGQYLLARAESYHALGGHAAIAHALVDDFALARQFHSSGFTVALVDGSTMLQCRMYHSFREVWNGFSKNLLIALAPATDSPADSLTAPKVRGTLANLLRASLRALLFAWGYACVFVLPFVRLLRPGQRPIARSLAALEVCWLLSLRSLVAYRLKRPTDEIVTTPLAAWGVMAISLAALVRRWRKRPIVWKQRRYANPTL